MRGIGGLILAAGGSTRLGEPKQLVTMHGETLVHAAVRAAQEGGCDPVCVVTGHAGAAVADAVADLHPLRVHNDEWPRGIGHSLRLGLAHMPPVSAVVILTCDQPAVTRDIVRCLIERHQQSGCAIAAAHYAGTAGIPALFDATCFPELRELPDDRGAKAVILADPRRVTTVAFEAGAFDLDTPDDLRSWNEKAAVPPDEGVRDRFRSCGTSGCADSADQPEPDAAVPRP